MNGALVISWGNPVRGREAKGLETFGKALAHFEALAKQGRIHGHREFFSLTGNQSKWSGMQIVEGPLDELLKIQTEDATLRLLTQAQSIVENFTVGIAGGGDEHSIQEMMSRYVEVNQELGVM